MTLGPAKHEKVARKGRISNVFRIAGAQSAEQSVGIMGSKYLLTPTSLYNNVAVVAIKTKYDIVIESEKRYNFCVMKTINCFLNNYWL